MLCDRNKVNFAGSQVGFINFVIHPYFAAISAIIPSLQYQPDEAKANVDRFAELKDEYEEHMKKGNMIF